MYELPTSITIDGVNYGIRNKGDYRVIQDCFIALNDYTMEEKYRVATALIIFYEDFNSIEDIGELSREGIGTAIDEMFNFFNCGDKNIGAVKPYRLIDWENDSQIIASSINAVAHTEIRSLEYLHWWSFMGYYLNIGEGVLATVVSIREKIVKQKKLEKYEKEFRQDNPHYFNWEWRTEEQIAEDKLIQDMWGD